MSERIIGYEKMTLSRRLKRNMFFGKIWAIINVRLLSDNEIVPLYQNILDLRRKEDKRTEEERKRNVMGVLTQIVHREVKRRGTERLFGVLAT